MTTTDHDVKITILRKNIEEKNVRDIIERKKARLFKSLLSRPKDEDIHVQSLKLNYECILRVSGSYTANYYRKATHTISVDSNVSEIHLGDGIFPVRPRSGLQKALAGNRRKNKIDFELEEHVFIKERDELIFDHHGNKIKFPFKINPKTIENYPKQLLEKNKLDIIKVELTHDAAINRLQSHLKKSLEDNVRKLDEKFTLQEIIEFYIPIFEARLIGPKKKIVIIRMDAVRKKIL